MRPGATTDRSISRQQKAAGSTAQWLSSSGRGLGWPAEHRPSARQADADWGRRSPPSTARMYPREPRPTHLARSRARKNPKGDNSSYTNSSPAPPPTVRLAWLGSPLGTAATLRDGRTGTQCFPCCRLFWLFLTMGPVLDEFSLTWGVGGCVMSLGKPGKASPQREPACPSAGTENVPGTSNRTSRPTGTSS